MSRAFTLAELLVSMAVLSAILLVLFSTTNAVNRIWKSSSQKIEAFAEARAAFEAMTRRLSQATLNTYYDYYDAAGNSSASATYSGTPAVYGRQSELHFISGPGLLPPSAGQITHAIFFHAPLGFSADSTHANLTNCLNAAGYYVVYDSDAGAGSCPPFVKTSRYRFRLMQFTQATEQLQIFNAPAGSGTTNNAWFTAGTTAAGNANGAAPNTHLLADNVVALVILPKRARGEDTSGTALCPDYTYDSRTPWTTGSAQPAQRHQLPPLLHVAMLAIDEQSAQRVCAGAAAPDLGLAHLFADASRLNEDLRRNPAKYPLLANDPSLEATLIRGRINYRIFETDIAIRGAKWSQ